MEFFLTKNALTFDYEKEFNVRISDMIGNKIISIDGVEPLECVKRFSEKYSSTSKNKQARLNNMIYNNFWTMNAAVC